MRWSVLLASLFGAALFAAVSPSAALADKNCDDFSSQAAAQQYFDANGGSPSNNVDGLDADADGVACEDNPCPCASPGGSGGGGGGGGGGGHKPKPPPIPQITKSDARYYAKIALNRRLQPWRAGTDKVLTCRHRVSRIRIKCRVDWLDDPVTLGGRIYIWFSREGDHIIWNYAWRIKHTNQACLDAGQANCTGYYVVH
jgi:hypothetical protein